MIDFRESYSIEPQLGGGSAIAHPEHYNKGGIECFDVIKSFGGDVVYEGFLYGNVLKYLCRCNHKGEKLEDLKKALFYLNELVDLAEMNNTTI